MCYIIVFCLLKWNNGVKEILLCDLYGLKSSSISMMKKTISLLAPRHDLGGHWFGLV
jgi:hypothetical protein